MQNSSPGFAEERLGRYLSPEPLLQSPAYVRRMAQSGLSVPTYAYANNNPLRYVDSDGLRFRNPSPAERRAINNLMKDPVIGPRVRYFNDTNDVLIDLRARKGVSTISKFVPGRQGGGCGTSRPSTFTTTYDLAQSQWEINATFGLELTLEQLIAHELGHLDYELEQWLDGQVPDDDASNFRGVLWENYRRDINLQRMSHEALAE